jgi:hypothetical protein
MKKVLWYVAVITLVQLAIPTWTLSYQREDVKRILKRLEEDTDRFAKSLDSALDHSPINGTQAEDEINKYVHQFEEATDRLKDRYEDQGYAPNAAREVLGRGQSIDRFMRQHRLGSKAEGDWQIVRSDLNLLARAFRISWRW